MSAEGADVKLSYTLDKGLIFRIYEGLEKIRYSSACCNPSILDAECEIL